MAPSDVVNNIVSETSTYLTYMLPIIGILSGIMLVLSFLYHIVTRIGSRTFNK